MKAAMTLKPWVHEVSFENNKTYSRSCNISIPLELAMALGIAWNREPDGDPCHIRIIRIAAILDITVGRKVEGHLKLTLKIAKTERQNWMCLSVDSVGLGEGGYICLWCSDLCNRRDIQLKSRISHAESQKQTWEESLRQKGNDLSHKTRELFLDCLGGHSALEHWQPKATEDTS